MNSLDESILMLDEKSVFDGFANLTVGIDVSNTQQPDAKTRVGKIIEYSVGKVLSQEISLIRTGVLAMSHQFEFVLMRKKCLANLRHLEIYSQRCKFAVFFLATKIAPRAQTDVQVNGLPGSVQILKCRRDIVNVVPLEHD
jgi:hypothetical protein